MNRMNSTTRLWASLSLSECRSAVFHTACQRLSLGQKQKLLYVGSRQLPFQFTHSIWYRLSLHSEWPKETKQDWWQEAETEIQATNNLLPSSDDFIPFLLCVQSYQDGHLLAQCKMSMGVDDRVFVQNSSEGELFPESDAGFLTGLNKTLEFVLIGRKTRQLAILSWEVLHLHSSCKKLTFNPSLTPGCTCRA